MAGSTYGTILRVTTWGESHGKALGAVVDGCPAGIPLCEDDIQFYMNRRKPGQNPYTTPRNEGDCIEILSGVFEGKTTGTPISMIVHNTNQHSGDYSKIKDIYRPGHADYTFDEKYGFRDYRGGGRSSGRETIGRVAAGAIAMQILKEVGIEVHAYTRSIGPVALTGEFNPLDALTTPTGIPNAETSAEAEKYLKQCMTDRDSAGGVIECITSPLPAGLGETVFDKADALLAQALMSIGAVKAVEIGDGIEVTKSKGSENNDSFVMKDGKVVTATNHCGGILGGMTNGSPLLVKAHVKPTPSILTEQNTVTNTGEETVISIPGRHDPVIVPRAVVVVECMVAFTLADLLLRNMSAKAENLHKIYDKE